MAKSPLVSQHLPSLMCHLFGQSLQLCHSSQPLSSQNIIFSRGEGLFFSFTVTDKFRSPCSFHCRCLFLLSSEMVYLCNSPFRPIEVFSDQQSYKAFTLSLC